jgi:hypothetical protein
MLTERGPDRRRRVGLPCRELELDLSDDLFHEKGVLRSGELCLKARKMQPDFCGIPIGCEKAVL